VATDAPHSGVCGSLPCTPRTRGDRPWVDEGGGRAMGRGRQGEQETAEGGGASRMPATAEEILRPFPRSTLGERETTWEGASRMPATAEEILQTIRRGFHTLGRSPLTPKP